MSSPEETHPGTLGIEIGAHWILDVNFQEGAATVCAFGLLPAEAAAEVAGVIEVVNTWQAHFAQVGLSARDIDSLAKRIDGEHLLAQRTGFNPARFQETPARKKRTSPF